MKSHLEHPSQATACGTIATQRGLPMDEFRAAQNKCRSCSRVLAALDSGRPANRGVDCLIERVYERSLIRRGRMAIAPVFYVVAEDGIRWRFQRKYKAQLFVARGRRCDSHTAYYCECGGQPQTTQDFPEYSKK